MSATYRYTIAVQDVVQSQNINVAPNCNGWTVINIGDSPLRVNGIFLNPSPSAGISGEGVSVGGNEGEIFDSFVQIVFDQTGGGVAPEAQFIQKIYQFSI